jgi:hypothetical protein
MSFRLSRRFMLRSSQVAIGLPLLHAMSARGQATAPKRFVFVFGANGADRGAFRPAAEGPITALSPLLEGFGDTHLYDRTRMQAPLLSDIVVVSGMQNNVLNPSPGRHAAGTAGVLTCQLGRGTRELGSAGLNVPYVGPLPGNGVNPRTVNTPVSFDWVLSSLLTPPGSAGAQYTPLNLCTEGPGNNGDADMRAEYINYVSWKTPTSYAPNQVDMRRVFEDLFSSSAGSPAGVSEFERRKRLRTLVLDRVTEQIRSLNQKVGAEDRLTLEQYFTSLSELERKLQQQTTPSATCSTQPTQPMGNGTTARNFEVAFELMKLILQCDRRRIITFMMTGGRSFLTLANPYNTVQKRGWWNRFVSWFIALGPAANRTV